MFNKSAIMKRAWNDYKINRGYEWAKNRTFAQCLMYAWKLAKEEIAEETRRNERARAFAEQADIKEVSKAKAVASLSVADKTKLDGLKKELFILECKDIWNDSDRAYSRKLQAQIDALETERTVTVSDSTVTIAAKAA